MISIFILVANIIAIVSTYFSFGKKLGKDKKMMYTMIAIGVIYILTLIVYLLSSIGVNNSNVTSASREMITFTFVPVNTIILLPFLIRSFEKAKNKEIKTAKLNQRVIIFVIIAVILMITEFFYFRNIQKNIIDYGAQVSNSVQQ